MTDANGLTALDADFYRPDAVTWVRVALTYPVWVEKIERRPYSEVCKAFAKGVSG